MADITIYGGDRFSRDEFNSFATFRDTRHRFTLTLQCNFIDIHFIIEPPSSLSIIDEFLLYF